MLDLHWCSGLLPVAQRGVTLCFSGGLLTVVAALVSEHGLQAHGLRSCGFRALEYRLSSCSPWV